LGGGAQSRRRKYLTTDHGSTAFKKLGGVRGRQNVFIWQQRHRRTTSWKEKKKKIRLRLTSPRKLGEEKLVTNTPNETADRGQWGKKRGGEGEIRS